MPSCPWRVGAALLGDKRVVYVDGGCWLGLKLSQDWEGGKLLASFLFFTHHIHILHGSMPGISDRPSRIGIRASPTRSRGIPRCSAVK